MFEFHGTLHLLASLLVAIHHVSGNNKVPTPKRPKMFCFGWPNVSSVTVSMETVPVDGVIQYDLFYNRTCRFVSFNDCSSAVTDLSLVQGCRRIENQTLTSVHTSATKVFSCTICNSAKNCHLMGITKNHDLCLYLRVNSSFGSSHVCMERGVQSKIVFPPPKAIQLLATAKKQLTVLWEYPEGIEPSGLQISYKVILRDQFGQCSNFVKEIYGNGNINYYNFTDLSPWSNYSVTICSGPHMTYIPVNDTTCTCGDDYHLPGGPVFSHTLPEGNNKVPTPKRPKVYCFGWPNVSSVTVSMETVPVDGVIQYDLFYNRTCRFVSFNEDCSSAVTDLSLVQGCRRVENQTLTSLHTSPTKVFSCTICSSTKDCYLMGITKDNDLCLYLRVNIFGSSHVCMERGVQSKIVFPPPKAIQLLATAKKQLTVLWEHPEGIEPSGIQISYKVILQDQFGQCSRFVKELYGNGNINSYNFTDLSPWCSYSVTICSGPYMTYIPVNDTTCTCGDGYHLPGGPVFSHTLPEEPSEQPFLEPCEAFCDETNFNATLKWKASKDLIWNGIPTKSVISIWNSSSPDQEENELGAPTATFSVPLESNYNGSSVTLTMNLTRHLKYIAKVQFCSNGGCGPVVMTTLSCDVCESLGAPDPTSGNYSKNAESHWQLATGTGVSLFILVVAVIVTMVINKKKRQRNYASLRDVIGDLQPAIYEEPDSADMTSDEAPYSQVYSSESHLLPKDDQTAQWV